LAGTLLSSPTARADLIRLPPLERKDMEARSPYIAPRAKVADAHNEEYGEIKVFSASGRIGRIRYIGYSVGLMLLFAAVLGVIAAIVGPKAAGVVMVIGYVLMLVVMFLMSIQRAHDFNTTGWISILALVPLVNLIFWFIPGTDGENEYGLKTPPNRVGVTILAMIMPVVFITGILAAIALPAYSDYVKRAQIASASAKR
jgi:uncharacterized membrane protein YhaH (DUF805 family)